MVRASQCYTLLTVFKEQTFKGQKGKKRRCSNVFSKKTQEHKVDSAFQHGQLPRPHLDQHAVLHVRLCVGGDSVLPLSFVFPFLMKDFILSVWIFLPACVYIHHMCAVSAEARRGHWILRARELLKFCKCNKCP